MAVTRRSRRRPKKNSSIEYHTDESLTEAENTMFSDWMQFWKEQNFMEPDLTVHVEDRTYQLHSTVMIFWSEYFQENLKERKRYIFELREMKGIYFDSVLEFMYRGDFVLDEESLGNIINIADELKIASILKVCTDYIILNLRKNSEQIVDLVELLCLSSNQYSLKIIIPQLLKRWDKFGSDKVLRRIPFEVMKLMITYSNKIPRLDDRNLTEICCTWIGADIEHRFCHITELLECMTGKMNISWNFDYRCYAPKNFADVKHIFLTLLHCCISGQKIDFFNHFGLVIRKENDTIVNKKINEENLMSCLHLKKSTSQRMSQFYFKQWQDKMKALRQISTFNDIVVEVDAGQVFNLDYWILCVSSKFFRDLDTDSRSHVRLNLKAQEFVSVLYFMYGKVLHITSDNIYNIIQASRLLKLSSCQKLILKYLKKNITTLNTLKLFENSFSEDSDEVLDFLKFQVLRKFTNFQKHSILCLRLDCFKWLITSSSKMLKALSIDDRIDLCCDWIARDIRNRYLSGPELFQALSYLDKTSEKSFLEKLNFKVKLRKKVLSTFPNPTTDSSDKPVYGKHFVVNVSRIDLKVFENLEDRDVQKNSRKDRSFYIRIARSERVRPY